MCAFFISMIIAATAFGSVVKDPVYDELEGLPLVEALIRDGKTAAAKTELEKMKPSEAYWKAKGDIAMADEKWSQALNSYKNMLSPQKKALYSARAAFELKDHKACTAFFRQSQKDWLDKESDIIKKATCEANAGESEKAWNTLLAGLKNTNSFPLQREQVAFQLSLGLANEALKNALRGSEARSTAELLGLAELFHDKKESLAALTLVEVARVRAPFDLEANLSAAQIYFQRGDLRTTADAFERASHSDRKFSYHAAEIHRQLRQPERSAYFAQLIPQEKERLKSRMALYVESNRYPLIASMESVIGRSALKDDDEMRYAMAYSLLRQGDTVRPLLHLRGISKPELLEKAALLRKAALDCRSGSCSL